MSNFYSNLLLPASSLSEQKTSYGSLTERHVQIIWLEQKYFKTLHMMGGEALEVLSPGIWNKEAGPDFLKAHVRMGSQELKGDIEIHLAEESWYQHHHHTDERYNQVILHLCLWNPVKPRPIYKKNGEEVLTIYLEEFLTVPFAHLIQLIDLDLYPYKKGVGNGRCAQSLFKNLPDNKIESFFASAAQWRLEQKKEYLQARMVTAPLQLMGGIAMALGYKHNTQAFLDLFLFLWPDRHLPEKVLLARGLGCCGFFDQRAKITWDVSSYYRELKELWWGQQEEVIHQAHLCTYQIRPLNHPIRRLVYLIKLLQEPILEKFWIDLLKKWEGSVALIKQNQLVYVRQQLLSVLPSYEDAYWNRHYTFEQTPAPSFLSLIGENLKIEMLINTFLPLLYATIKERGDQEQWRAFQTFYASIRALETSKSRYLAHRFFGDTSQGMILNKAQMEQGAYQLHKDFCLHFEASCEGCPFVERYLNRC